jgi:hypothetical protein
MSYPPIFVSYSQKNAAWLEDLKPYLGLFENDGTLGYWSDQQIRPGEEWEPEINKAIDNASVVVLLVSREMLESEFILTKELPRFRAILRREQPGRLSKIMPLLLEPCEWQSNRDIAARDLRPKGRGALGKLDKSERRQELLNFAMALAEALSEAQATSAETISPVPIGDAATLELLISHCERDVYEAALTLGRPSGGAPEPSRRVLVKIDPGLLPPPDDPQRYGRQLYHHIFESPEGNRILSTLNDPELREAPLRVRICIDPSALELRSLRWETLCHTDRRFEQAVIARYVTVFGPDSVPAHLRRGAMDYRALIAALILEDGAEPEQGQRIEALEQIAGLYQRCGIRPKVVSGWHAVDALADLLRDDDGSDFVYLHLGACDFDDDTAACCHLPRDSNQKSVMVRRGISEAVALLEHAPRHVVLAPEQPPQAGCWQWLVHLAADLATCGTLGILNREGHLSTELWHAYLEENLRGLVQHGLVDKAGLAACEAIAANGGRWQPTSTARLRSSRIWYQPRFMDASKTKAYWGDLIDQIKDGHCIPIVGSGIDYRVARFRERIAQVWAERYQYPLGKREAARLSQIAQYLVYDQSSGELVREYKRDLDEHLDKYYARQLKAASVPEGASLEDKLSGILLASPSEPHRILAQLPFHAYLTANYNNAMALALHKAKRSPVEAQFRSGGNLDWTDSEQSEQHPLVYHLFGTLGDTSSLVLTEDDYFEFLIDLWRERGAIPLGLSKALTSSSILFLGFNLNHWDFRILFRSLIKLEGWYNAKRRTSFAVQVSPDDDLISDPDRAQAYLEKYFREISSKVVIYWGSSEDFLQELETQWHARNPPRQARNP